MVEDCTFLKIKYVGSIQIAAALTSDCSIGLLVVCHGQHQQSWAAYI